MHLLLKRLYGSSSEKFDPRQGVLFDAQAAEGEAAASTPVPPPIAPPVPKNRDRHGRGRIPEQIQREEVIHDLSEAEMVALGGAENLVELPPERSEQLDWRPSTLFVVVHVRKKYARKVPLPESGLTLAEQNVAVARKPPEAIPGALAAPGLMAQVIVSKGADHLPLHRLEGIFKRQGLRISRQTMDGWWLQTAEFLQPLYALAVRVVLASHVIHTDDTSVKVRDAWQKRKYTGRFTVGSNSIFGMPAKSDFRPGSAGRERRISSSLGIGDHSWRKSRTASPVTPCRSQERLPPLRWARLAPMIPAISRAYFAPLTWK